MLFLRSLALCIAFGLWFWFLKLPLEGTPVIFWDDGETLYHALALVQGQVPYRDDHTHHFVGYALPVAALTALWGFDIEVLRTAWAINQAILGLCVTLALFMIVPRTYAIIGGLLALSAREPYVISFFPLAQVSMWYCVVISLCVYALKTQRLRAASLASIAAGIAFICDQRGLFLSILPCVTLCLIEKRSFRSKAASTGRIALGMGGFILPALLALLWLAAHDALLPFFEQTYIFPKYYRIGSFSFLEVIQIGLAAHEYLIDQSPILLCFGILGALALVQRARTVALSTFEQDSTTLIFWAVVPPFLTPFPGARDFDYYTLLWLPYLAILAAQMVHLVPLVRARTATLIPWALCTPLLFSLISTLHLLNYQVPYQGDGVQETVAFLRREMKADDTLYVWGYRLDIYTELERTSALPFVNRLMILPDFEVSTTRDRSQHVYPKYENMFLESFPKILPTYLVTFVFKKREFASTPAQELVNTTIALKYEKVFEISKSDFQESASDFVVYRLKNQESPAQGNAGTP